MIMQLRVTGKGFQEKVEALKQAIGAEIASQGGHCGLLTLTIDLFEEKKKQKQDSAAPKPQPISSVSTPSEPKEDEYADYNMESLF
mgnify:CR=1 FL=1